MPLDFQTALSQYGFVAVMAQSHPELKPLLDQAVKEEWDSARFQRELADTAWYKRRSERQRAIAVQQATDPGTWANTVKNKKTEVHALINRLGLTAYGTDVGYWAQQALENDWDEATLRTMLMAGGPKVKFAESGGFTGEAGEIETHVRETYAAFGVPLSADRVKQIAMAVIGGRNTLGGIDNEVRNQAKKQYAQFADEIDAGLTLQDIADPYVQTMANVLELPGSQLNLTDPSIKRALQYQDPASKKPAIKPLWQFERELKDDSRWQFTKQATNETAAILQQVGQDWGFQ